MSDLILGLETSCDETAASVVAQGVQVLSHVVASQYALHEAFLGVVPEIASRAHVQHLTPVVEKALAEAGVDLSQIAGIAVGNRPGLIGSLIVGVSAAKALSWSLGLPLIGVDHVQAHLYACELREREDEAVDAAALSRASLGLVISGGHTSLYRFTDPTELTLIGRTIDDAIGEAFDKAAVMLGLGHPGGPAIDQLAERGDPEAIAFPRSLLDPDSLDFSFSGLKTAVLYAVRGQPQGRGKNATFERSHEDLSDQQRADVAASFQAAAVQTIVLKLERAVKQAREAGEPVQRLVLGGGVSANRALRQEVQQFADREGLQLGLPQMTYCVDNAAMIAGLAWHRFHIGRYDDLSLPAVATTRV